MSNQLQEQPQACDTEDVRRSILIVEDDPTIADVLTIRLDQQGFESRHASTGAQAMQMVRQRRPHLVLMDLRLPDTDGFSICQKMDEDPETCDIPRIVLSGMARPDIIRATRSAGCKFFVRKPYDPNALLILIEQALEESGEW